MRDYGFPAAQAKRFSWHSPTSNMIRISDFRLRVEEMALGVRTKRINRMEEEGIPFNEDSESLRAYVDVEEGLKKSTTTYEAIMDGTY